MKLPLLLLCTLLAAVLCGCIPESKHPLCAPEDAIPDTRLHGVWRAESGKDVIYLHFGKGQGRELKAAEVDHPADGSLHSNAYTVFATEIEGVRYLNIRPAGDGPRPYFFARYGVDSEDVLRIWLMSEKPVVAAIQAGKLKGEVSRDKNTNTTTVKLADSTARLAAFVRRADRRVLFGELFGEFRRVGALLPAKPQQ